MNHEKRHKAPLLVLSYATRIVDSLAQGDRRLWVVAESAALPGVLACAETTEEAVKKLHDIVFAVLRSQPGADDFKLTREE